MGILLIVSGFGMYLSHAPSLAAEVYFGNGCKVGEVTDSTAILWTRLTARPDPDFAQLPSPNLARDEKAVKAPMPKDILPGISGQVRILWWVAGETEAPKSTAWMTVEKEKDFTLQYVLNDLQPGSFYRYEVFGRTEDGVSPDKLTSFKGQFQTAPSAASADSVRFIVSTCQAIGSVDSDTNGHAAYKWMAHCDPDFFVHTGDFVYYDKPPLSKNQASARAKWNLMFGYGYTRGFLQNVASYFIKDDHDTLDNDCWPGQTYGDLTFAQGQAIFREQVPMGDLTYRTIRWGNNLQIWLTENRDYRSSNTDPDGPGKTILGKEQMAWLRKTVRESDARFKIIISPDPIVGPDKPGKNDNHANEGFQTEGQLLRDYLSGIENTYVICGDRHWQYASKDPKTGLIEWGCGPINDEHDFGGNPGYSPEAHLYFNKGGGFLMVEVNAQKAVAKWFEAPASIDHEGPPPQRCRLELPYLPPSNETVPDL